MSCCSVGYNRIFFTSEPVFFLYFTTSPYFICLEKPSLLAIAQSGFLLEIYLNASSCKLSLLFFADCLLKYVLKKLLQVWFSLVSLRTHIKVITYSLVVWFFQKCFIGGCKRLKRELW